MPEAILIVLCGIAAGWLAGKTVGAGGMGVWQDMVIGVAGAFLTKWACSAFGFEAQGNFFLLLGMAIVGAVAITIAIRTLQRFV